MITQGKINNPSEDPKKAYIEKDCGDKTDCNQLLYDIILNTYQTEWQRTHDIENKASGVVGFVGVILSLTIVTLASIITSVDEDTKVKIFSTSIFLPIIVIVFILMILSIFCGILALSVKNWWFIIADNLINYCSKNNMTTDQFLIKMTSELTKGININSRKNDRIAFYLKSSYILFLSSIVIVVSYFAYIIYVCV